MFASCIRRTSSSVCGVSCGMGYGAASASRATIVKYAVSEWREAPSRRFSASTRTPTSIDVRHAALTRHPRHPILQGLLEEVEVGPVPGQEKLVVVGAGDWQRQPVDPRPVLEAAVIADRLRFDDRFAEAGQLAFGETASAAPVAKCDRCRARRRRGGAHRFLPRGPRRRAARKRGSLRRSLTPAIPPATAATGRKLRAVSSAGIPAMWAKSKAAI